MKDKIQLKRRKSFLVIHHIDWDPSNNDPRNLIVLCRSCHGKVRASESCLPNAPRSSYPRKALLKAARFQCQLCGWAALAEPQPSAPKKEKKMRLIRQCAGCKQQFIGRKSTRKYDLCPRCNQYFAGRLTGICINCGAPAQSHDIKFKRNGKEVWIHQMCPPFATESR